MNQPAPFNYKILISYDGTAYSGWQIQPQGKTIQEEIEKALQLLAKEPVRVIGSGRTDAGVHAYGQVAHFRLSQELPTQLIFKSLNGLLAKDIRIHQVERAPDDFHAIYSAQGKIYHYNLHLEPVVPPFYRLYRHHIPHPIDLDLLKEATSLFVGTHDFTSFANSANQGAASKNAVRTISRIDLVPIEGGVRLEFEGNGFLYKMVRNSVGTLLDVAQYKRPIGDIPQIFAAKDRRQASRAAAARGLFLMHVHYPNSFD